ncbi:DUF6269 family protein [Streptomyces malaysiensis]|uniref:DUF6269 family protein n=1 Tax=Streptomyces malaysiensis TaxID=92644 RepID=UPI000BFF1CD5|nr:DUF6269 family protein [Streptomyces malaysiensis]ATL86032.1 triple helix repeat-containing collagen [Streptomyces malaysiensis]
MTDDPTPPAATEPPWAFLARLEEQIAHDQEACLRDCAAPWGELLERFVDALTGRQHPDADAADAAKGDAGGGEAAGEPEGPEALEVRGGSEEPNGANEPHGPHGPHGPQDPDAPDGDGGPNGPDPANGTGAPHGPKAPDGTAEPHGQEDPGAPD